MANPTLADLITRVRVNVKDDSGTSANQSLTDANITGFINIGHRIVQRRYAPRIVPRTGTQTGLSFAASAFSDLTNETNYSKIVTLMLVPAGGNTYGPALGYKDPEAFMNLAYGQSSTDQATGAGTSDAAFPIYWTGWREGTATPADQGKWRVLIHPPSSATVLLAALVEIERADLASGTDSPDVPPEGCSMIEAIASYLAASVLGRSWASSFLEIYPELKEAVAVVTRDALRHSPREKGRA